MYMYVVPLVASIFQPHLILTETDIAFPYCEVRKVKNSILGARFVTNWQSGYLPFSPPSPFPPPPFLPSWGDSASWHKLLKLVRTFTDDPSPPHPPDWGEVVESAFFSLNTIICIASKHFLRSLTSNSKRLVESEASLIAYSGRFEIESFT